MAKYVQITGLKTYPSRKYSIRTIEQIEPFIKGIKRYICFSYDYHKYTELLNILEEGGSFEQQEKKNPNPTVFSYNKETFELTINSSVNKRLCNTFYLNQEVLEDIVKCIKEDAINTISDNRIRKAAEEANNVQRTAKCREKLLNAATEKTILEQQKEEKVEEIKQEEEKLVETQKNDNNEAIIGQSVPQAIQQEEVVEEKVRTLYDLNEAVSIILEREGLTKEELNKTENAGKKFDILSSLFPSQKRYFENRYKFTGPSDMFEELKKYFSK